MSTTCSLTTLTLIAAVLALSVPAYAAQDPVGRWELTFLWEGEEDDSPVTVAITEEDGALIGTATSEGKLVDRFEVDFRGDTLEFTVDLAGVALLEGYTFNFSGTLDGNVVDGRFSANGMPSIIRGIGRRTRDDSTPHFTAAQASVGQHAYRDHCAACHGAELEGIGAAPALVGIRFDQTWRGTAVDVFAFHLRRMPPGATAEPSGISDETRLEVLAYLLSANGMTPSETALPADMTDLGGLRIPRLEGVVADPDAPAVSSAAKRTLLETLPPVTDTLLRDPSPSDWLHWGRTGSFHNYSPLDQVNRQTVGRLKPVWRAQLQNGRGNPAPLVHHGIMFLQTYPDRVLAIEATTGDVLWRYEHPLDIRSVKKMGIALHDDTVIVPTSDMQIVALRAQTGKVVWRHAIAHDRPGLGLGSTPLVAGDKVIQGVMGFLVPEGPFIVAVDIETGEEAWRFHTIARPGEPGGNSWNGLPLERRSGGNVWHQGTYDPELNLVYYGPTATYDHEPLRDLSDQPGVTNDALFTNTTLALDADTGELVWHFQHLRNDQWNFDWGFERQIINLTGNGAPRKILLTTGKMAITDALDAATGEYLFSIDAGIQNVVASIDPLTGVKTIRPEARPRAGSNYLTFPNHYGARSWAPTAYDPARQRLYLPLTEGAQIVDDDGWQTRFPPGGRDGSLGRIQAVEIGTQELGWRFETASPALSGILTTGGDLVFAADLNRTLRAHDADTGAVLWQTTLDDLPNSNIITYGVDGRQYVAIVVGLISDNAEDWEMTYRRFAPDEGLPINDAPKGGAAIWVFAL